MTLPKLLDWYRDDFGQSTRELLLRVAAMLDGVEGREDGPEAKPRNGAVAMERDVGPGSGYEPEPEPEEGWGLEEGGEAVRAAVLGDYGGDLTIEYAPYSWAQPEHK